MSPAILHPDEAWVVAQADSYVAETWNAGLRVRYVQHDRDTKFTATFDRSLRRRRVKPIRNPFRSPNMNAFFERFMRSIESERLDHFIVFGEQHFDRIVRS